MRTIHILATLATALMIGTSAFSKPRISEKVPVFNAIKTVPDGATIEYRAPGQAPQVLSIPRGVYQISINQLK